MRGWHDLRSATGNVNSNASPSYTSGLEIASCVSQGQRAIGVKLGVRNLGPENGIVAVWFSRNIIP